MAHPFFAGIDWDALQRLEVAPPFKPRVESETDIANFDTVGAAGCAQSRTACAPEGRAFSTGCAAAWCNASPLAGIHRRACRADTARRHPWRTWRARAVPDPLACGSARVTSCVCRVLPGRR
jgi:hypothetical protein